MKYNSTATTLNTFQPLSNGIQDKDKILNVEMNKLFFSFFFLVCVRPAGKYFVL